MAGKFELKKSKSQFMFNLKAGNGQVILTSERYKTKKSAENGIKSVKANAKSDKSYDRKTAKNGKSYFALVAKNKEIIGMSQMYASASGRNNGIKCVKKVAPGAKTEDLT